jgi:hypothetical protein
VPELVIPGETGFLYAPGEIDDFVAKILFIHQLIRSDVRDAVSPLDWIRHAARVQVLHNFNRRKNLTRRGDQFLQRITEQDCAARNSGTPDWSPPHEDLVLQQI